MFKVKLDKGLLKTIDEIGFENHTKTEKKTISQIKSGKNFIAKAPKGDGKTTSIVISVVQLLKRSFEDVPRALIAVIDEEEAEAMKTQFDLLGKHTDLRVFTAHSNKKLDDNRDEIYLGCDVVIGTPTRINDLMKVYGLNIGNLMTYIIDNGEVVFKGKNLPYMNRIASTLPKKVQQAAFVTQDNKTLTQYFKREIGYFDEIVIEKDPISEQETPSDIE